MAQNTEELKAKISIDTSEAGKNIAALTKEGKLLSAEIKLADAAIKNEGKTTDNLAAKKKTLQDRVKNLKDTIAQYEAKLAAVTAREGANSSSAIKLKTDITKLKTALSDTEKEVSDVEKELKDMGDEADDTTKSTKSLKETLSDASTSISESLQKIKDSAVFKGVTNLFSALAQSYEWMTTTATDAASSWDDLATAAARAQEDVSKYQAMEYASAFLDFDISAYYRGKNKIQKATEEEITSAFADAGMTFDWTNVDFGDKDSVYTAILAQLGGADDAQQALIEAALFGERLGTNLRTVYGEDAVEQLKELQKEAERLGMITTESQAESLQYLNDAHDKWLGVKEGLFMNLGSVFADNLTGLFDGLSEYVGIYSKALQLYHDAGGGEEGKAAMEEYINGALTAVDENGDTVGSKFVKGLTGTIENFGVLADLASVVVDSIATELSTNEALQTALSSLWDSLGNVWNGEDGESGLVGMFTDLYDNIIKPYVLDPLASWLTAEAAIIGAEIGAGIVDAIPGLRAALEAVNAATDPSNYTPESLADNPMTSYDPIWNTDDDAPDSPRTGGGGGEGAPGAGRIVTDTYTETDNSEYNQNVTIYVTGATNPTQTGQTIAETLADYEALLKRSQTGGGTGVTRSGNVYD